mgnify:CR=1 FL=1
MLKEAIEKIEELAKSLLKNPVEIKLAVSKPAEKIKQEAYVCYEAQKMSIIKDIFKAGDLKRVIIFCGSKTKVKQLSASLQQQKINCGEMHSDLSQQERDDIMFKFKSGQIDVLVATDIVARGIDIDDITLVINFDVPHDTEDYVHRIGRTARADRDGRAITLVTEMDIYWFQQIEKFLEKVVEKMPLPAECGEGPEYVKMDKPKKPGKNNGNGKTSAKSRRQKDRDQTSHKRKPNKPNERQEKAPRSNEQQPQQGNKQQNVKQQPQQGNRQQNAKQQPQQGNRQQNAKQQNRKPVQPGEQPKNSNSQKRRNNSNNSNQQRPGTENNVRPGSNGRGRGVAQKKGDKPAARKHTPIVNPQKQENAVKKFIKRIFGFKK